MAKKKTRRWTKLDPSRTKTERQRFMREMKKRFGELAKAVRRFLVDEDAFGLEERKPFKLGEAEYTIRPAPTLDQMTLDHFTNRRQYQFLTNPQKVQQFRRWLQQQVDAGVLEVVGGEAGKPWTAPYIESAWRKGMMRAYTDVRKQDLSKSLDWYNGTKEQWLRSSLLQPEMMSKVELLATRAFEGMKGITESISTKLSRLLADGLVNGYSPKKIAKQMTDTIGTINRSRALAIARTEIIHAHAEGQLDGYTTLGISEVSAEVEWSTAGDALVCEQCASMNGKTYKVKDAHGMIPLHVNCRCAWIPVVEKSGKKRKK